MLRVLKEYGDKQGERRIFDYFAAGWNRDGLALRGMEELMQSAPAEKHLLLILTDANPDDSHRIPPNGKNPISREYDGKAGVEDSFRWGAGQRSGGGPDIRKGPGPYPADGPVGPGRRAADPGSDPGAGQLKKKYF